MAFIPTGTTGQRPRSLQDGGPLVTVSAVHLPLLLWCSFQSVNPVFIGPIPGLTPLQNLLSLLF